MKTTSQYKVRTRKPNAQPHCRRSKSRARFELGTVSQRTPVSSAEELKLLPVAIKPGRVNPECEGVHSPNPANLDDRVWTIVLSGGEGERLRPLMTRWLGVHRPKQYCTFVGSHSMLRHTLDRAERLTGVERTFVVVASHHEPRHWDRLESHHEEAIIAQPRNRDTAPGIFLPLTYIRARDPEATVVILPSDHFVHPQETFLAAIRRAVQAAQCQPDKLVLLGVCPDTAETEYGWIQPGISLDSIDGELIRRVTGFREKPNANEARRLLRSGGLWNTLVIAVSLPTLWRLGRRCVPAMMKHFEDFAPSIGTDKEPRALDSLYNVLPSANFSTQVLQQALDSLVVMELRDVLWSDWGSERRIVETLQRIGKSPLFLSTAMNSPTQTVSTL